MANTSSPLELHEVISLLRSTPIVLRNLLNVLPNGAAAWHPSAGKWCIKEVVGHLIEEDKRDFVGRIRVTLDQDEPHLTVTDQEEVARMRGDCDKSLDDLLDEFSAVRDSSVAFVSALKGSELRRGGVHPKIGRLQITNLLHEWIYHDLNHIRQINANIQSLLWAHLGNMQRFYHP
jgi:hypothetical protein